MPRPRRPCAAGRWLGWRGPLHPSATRHRCAAGTAGRPNERTQSPPRASSETSGPRVKQIYPATSSTSILNPRLLIHVVTRDVVGPGRHCPLRHPRIMNPGLLNYRVGPSGEQYLPDPTNRCWCRTGGASSARRWGGSSAWGSSPGAWPAR